MPSKTDRRGHEPRHVRLYHSFTGCPAWDDLSGNSVKGLIALARLDKGQDNGALFLSVRAMAAAVGCSPNTAARIFRELEDHGFIAAVDRGHFKVKGGPATTWRLTWAAAPGCKPSAPTRDFERWQKPVGNKTRSQKLRAAVAKIDTVDGNAAHTVAKIATADVETPLVSVAPGVSNIGTQVVCHRQGAEPTVFEQRKQANSAAGPKTDLLGADILADLREAVMAYLDGAGVGAQSRLAEAAKIPGGTLSKFLTGRGLGRTHFVSLQVALRRAQDEEQRAVA